MNITSTKTSVSQHGKTSGLTLLEVVITVAIIGILSAIAIPSYNYYTETSHRTIATSALMELASREQKYYSSNNAFTSNLSTLGYPTTPPNTSSSIYLPNGTNPYYILAVQVPMPTLPTSGPTSFYATATPTGTQQNDKCGMFVLTSQGLHTAQANHCW